MHPDLLDGSIIKGSVVRREASESVILLDANRNRRAVSVITFLKVALVQVRCPRRVSVNLSCVQAVLERDDILAGNRFRFSMRPLHHGTSKYSWEQSSEEQEGAFEMLHGVT